MTDRTPCDGLVELLRRGEPVTAELREHASGCDECTRLLASVGPVEELAVLAEEIAPAELRERIAEQLSAHGDEPRSKITRRGLVAGAVGAAVLVGTGAGVWWYRAPIREAEALLDLMIADHLEYRDASDWLEIESQEPAEVERWLGQRMSVAASQSSTTSRTSSSATACRRHLCRRGPGRQRGRRGRSHGGRAAGRSRPRPAGVGRGARGGVVRDRGRGVRRARVHAARQRRDPDHALVVRAVRDGPGDRGGSDLPGDGGAVRGLSRSVHRDVYRAAVGDRHRRGPARHRDLAQHPELHGHHHDRRDRRRVRHHSGALRQRSRGRTRPGGRSRGRSCGDATAADPHDIADHRARAHADGDGVGRRRDEHAPGPRDRGRRAVGNDTDAVRAAVHLRPPQARGAHREAAP